MGWLLVCYIPQWARIISRKSAEGFPTLYILLGSLSGMCAVTRIMMLPPGAVDIGCCHDNTPFACISSLLGMLQIVFGFTSFCVVYVVLMFDGWELFG